MSRQSLAATQAQRFLHGAHLTFATAYQSCRVLSLPPLNNDVPDLRGIEVVGVARDGGDIRKITSLRDFVKSNPYYKGYSVQKNCMDMRKMPVIYNYGGRPIIQATASGRYVVDLFKMQIGSGDSREDGIDCSGFVATALAAAGIRLHAGVDFNPDDISNIDTYQFMEPQQNGFSCLQKASMGVNGSLRAGDIVVKPGHMVLVDSVGQDPLAFNSIKEAAACDKISSDDFDFVMMQSSSTKDGLGLNKYVGSDLLDNIDDFKNGLLLFARQACRARLQGKVVYPNDRNIQVLRVRESPECVQQPVYLTGQSCVQACVQ